MIVEPIPPGLQAPVETPFGPVTPTHRAWGQTHQPWHDMVQSYFVLGTMVDGKFVAIAGTEDYQTFAGADYAVLRAPNAQGKAADSFRNDDVIARHKAKRGLS